MTPPSSAARGGPPASAAVVPDERALLFTLAAIQFTHIVDFMVVMPLGPQFTSLFGISDTQFGLLVSAYTLAAGASGLLASTYIDRFERKRLLLAMYVAFALATLACGLAPSFGILMIARIAAGIFGGVLAALVQTIVGDAIPYERRGRAMGVVMASFSLATVAGVPASLWLAEAFGWQAAFIAIAAVSLATAGLGLRALPRLDAHVHGARATGPWRAIAAVLREPNHWRAFGFTALVMSAGFTIIPFITIYLTVNLGVPASRIPLIYLVGGVATFVSARLIGLAADRFGKVETFRAVAVVALVPMLAITHVGPLPWVALLVVTTLFFMFVSGRMVPALAIVTGATQPAMRGAFMSLNGAVQSGSMGVASMVGGALIGRDAQGLVTGYAWCGWLGAALSLTAIAWVSRVRTAGAAAAG